MKKKEENLFVFKQLLLGLLQDFRKKNIVDTRKEEILLKKHLSELYASWDEKFPNFPICGKKRRTLAWEYKRSIRDGYLRKIIISTVKNSNIKTIINPACVFGRHTRLLAKELPSFRIIGTDINASWDKF